jgi:alcohol dehydrogenase class IV
MTKLETVFEFKTIPCKFGVGATEEIGSAVRQMKVRKVLILCGQTVSGHTDIPEKVKTLIEREKIEVKIWDKIDPDSTTGSLEGIKNLLRDNEFDCFVGIGGGSTIATSKIIDLYSTYPQDFHDFIPAPVAKGKKVPGKIKPLILLPTTAGSGSEASEVANIDFIDGTGKKKKLAILSEYLLPSLAILDPLNTISMPPKLTASTGLDALLLAIGSYTARPYQTTTKAPSPEERPTYRGSNPFSDLLTEESIKLIGRYIRRSYGNGYDLEARTGMLFGSHLAGLAVAKTGVHIAHAITMAIGEKVHADAGFKVASTSPACLEFIAPILPERLNRIAQWLSEETGISSTRVELSASEILKRLLKDLDCPGTITGLGLSEKDIPELSERALKEQRLLMQSPRFVRKEDIEGILRASL